MILVTLGTQDKPFKRLLEEVERQIEKGNIKDKVIVQAGCTKFKSKNMEIFDLLPTTKFNKLLKECNLLITHAGVGTIIEGLKQNKKIIAVARLKKYKEHTNDHQLQLINNFTEEGYIIGLTEFDSLDDAIEKAKTFKPKKIKSNKKDMIKIIEDFIDSI